MINLPGGPKGPGSPFWPGAPSNPGIPGGPGKPSDPVTPEGREKEFVIWSQRAAGYIFFFPSEMSSFPFWKISIRSLTADESFPKEA